MDYRTFNLTANSLIEIFRNANLINKLNGVIFTYDFADSNNKRVFVKPLKYEDFFFSCKTENKWDTKDLEILKRCYEYSRPYKYLFHFDHFIKNFASIKHFKFDLEEPGSPIKDKLFYENLKRKDVLLEYKNILNNVSKTKDKTEEDFTSKKLDLLDQYFFTSGCDKFIMIPIPIFSSPVIVLVIDGYAENEYYWNNQDALFKLINWIYDLSKSTTRYHVFDSAINGLNQQLKNNIQSISSIDKLLEVYAYQVAKIIIPIDYELCKIKQVKEQFDSRIVNNVVVASKKILNCTLLNKMCKEYCRYYDNLKMNSCIKCEHWTNCVHCRLRKNHLNGSFEIIEIYEDSKTIPFFDDWKQPSEKDYSPYSDIHAEVIERPSQLCDNNDDAIIKISKHDYRFKFTLSLRVHDETESEEYLIIFSEPSFIFPIADRDGSYSSGWVRDLPDYAVAGDQIRQMLVNIWELIRNQWTQLRKINDHATKAAISQAMLRNVSHNHGSHVLVNLIHHKKFSDEKFQSILKDKEKANYIFRYDLDKDDDSKDGQIAIFNKYIKARMDFLSEITFGVSNMAISLTLENVFRELDKNLLLLNHISGIDGFPYEIEFVSSDKIPLHNFRVAFPSDILGWQALYNIIEAVIRNTAKYADKSKLKELDAVRFTLEFSHLTDDDDHGNQLIKVEIFDNLPVSSEVQLDKVIQNLLALTKQPVIDPKTNELRNKGLGVLEMQACAAFLRQIDVSEIDSEKYYADDREGLKNQSDNYPLLEPFKHEEGYLGYRFYLQKPEDFLFIGDWKIDASKRKILENQGIFFIAINDFIKSLEAGKTFNHQFIFYDSVELNSSDILNFMPNSGSQPSQLSLRELFKANRTIEGVSDFLTQLPVRMMDVNGSKQELSEILTNRDFKFLDLEEKIWLLWKDEIITQNGLVKNLNIDLVGGLKEETKQNDFSICLLNHAEAYLACKKSGLKRIEPLSSNAMRKLPDWGNNEKMLGYIQDLNKRDVNLQILKEFKDYLKSQKIPDGYENLHNIDDVEKFVTDELGFQSARPHSDKRTEIENENEKIGAISITKNHVKIFESFVSKVMVIDERVQKYSMDSYLEISNQEIFENINCLIPATALVNLAKRWFSNYDKKKICAFINRHIEKSDFFIIHYGLMERLFDNTDDRSSTIKMKLTEWAQKTRVIVTSGRGKHSLDLPKNVCYVNLSPVTNVFIENRSKYSINYLLNQTRR
jgi:hypothetical protein